MMLLQIVTSKGVVRLFSFVLRRSAAEQSPIIRYIVQEAFVVPTSLKLEQAAGENWMLN
jgi:hypothetical protein